MAPATQGEFDNPFEPGLAAALQVLSGQQRVAVVLHHGYQMTYREIAALLGIAPTTAQSHAGRGLSKLQQSLEVLDATTIP